MRGERKLSSNLYKFSANFSVQTPDKSALMGAAVFGRQGETVWDRPVCTDSDTSIRDVGDNAFTYALHLIACNNAAAIGNSARRRAFFDDCHALILTGRMMAITSYLFYV